MQRDRRSNPGKQAQKAELSSNELIAMSPADADSWIDDQVTDLESAKAVLKTMARAVAATTSPETKPSG